MALQNKKRKILLTGATGFLGSHLLAAFLKQQWEVSIIKRSFSNISRIEHLLPSVSYINIDKEPLELIFERAGKFDAVVHTATCYGRNGETAPEVLQSNLDFPLTLLNTATFFNTTTFFNTATILYEYLNYYALSKKQFEEWGKIYANQEKIGFVNLQLEHIYGPKDDSSKFTTFIFESLKNNVPHIDLTPGEQKRDFIYIDDVASAYITLLNSDKIINNKSFSVYDVGTGEAVSIREFVELAKKMLNSKSELCFGKQPYRQHEVMLSKADISALQEQGWEVQTTLQNGILKTIGLL